VCAYVCMCACVCIYMHVSYLTVSSLSHTHTHSLSHTHTHTHARTHAHTHTQLKHGLAGGSEVPTTRKSELRYHRPTPMSPAAQYICTYCTSTASKMNTCAEYPRGLDLGSSAGASCERRDADSRPAVEPAVARGAHALAAVVCDHAAILHTSAYVSIISIPQHTSSRLLVP
jgi:hypothetical protein